MPRLHLGLGPAATGVLLVSQVGLLERPLSSHFDQHLGLVIRGCLGQGLELEGSLLQDVGLPLLLVDVVSAMSTAVLELSTELSIAAIRFQYAASRRGTPVWGGVVLGAFRQVLAVDLHASVALAVLLAAARALVWALGAWRSESWCLPPSSGALPPRQRRLHRGSGDVPLSPSIMMAPKAFDSPKSCC